MPISEDRLSAIRKAMQDDLDLHSVCKYIHQGPVKMSKLSHSLHEFHTVRAHLSEASGLLLYKDRIVIPGSQRHEVLCQLHTGHQGLTTCRERANMSIWWPGFGKNITKTVETCEFCQVNKRESL